MAATAFQLYNKAKKYIGNGTIQLGVTPLVMALFRSGSNASTFTLSTLASVTNEISATGGYTAGGRALASLAWTTGVSAKQMKFDAADLVFTASGASLNGIKYAVIADGQSAQRLLGWFRLSSSRFNINAGNMLTIQFASQGIFTLT